MTSIPWLVKTNECKHFRCINPKNKTIFLNFFPDFRICIKFRTFSDKDDPHSLCIFEINDHETDA